MGLYGMLLCGCANQPATDVQRGVELIRRAAVKDDPLAAYYLAFVYAAGVPGIQMNLDRAEPLAQRAVDRGMLRGVGLLAKIYKARGEGRKTTQYILRAAEVGDPEAISAEVDVYLYGKTPDPAKAVELVRRGALLGEPVFMEQYAMALELETGGLKQDRVLSRQLLRRAIAMGNRTAEADWAYGQVSGAFGIEADTAIGLATLQRLADAHISDAELLLARLLMTGDHVKRDKAAGIALARLAAEHGNKRAQLELEQADLVQKER
jgi:TPR repeat protein